jgi:hypothetical protein
MEVHVYCTNPATKVQKVLVVFTEPQHGYLVAQLHINPYEATRVFVELEDFSCNSTSTLIFHKGKAAGLDTSQVTPWLDICRERLPEALRGLL